MDPELHENRGKIILDAIRRLYRQNSRVTLYKLIQKNHPTNMVWIFRNLNVTGPFVITSIDIVGVAGYFLIATTFLLA